jgi:hypothetical protein
VIASSIAQRIDEMLARAAVPERRERVAALRAEFEARTGSFAPSDPYFEARSAAFWDDALTRSAFGRELSSELGGETAALVEPLARAHRGLFRVEARGSARDAEGGFHLVDEWSGAEFVALAASEGLSDALERAAGLIDGRVIGAGHQIVLLPGALFHAADALEPMRALLPLARQREMATHELLDALLRMDHSLRALSRVKAAFAYRKEALAR